MIVGAPSDTAKVTDATEPLFVDSRDNPAPAVSVADAKRSIDDLVGDALRYGSSDAYQDLLHFVGRFRRYAPFNALLIHAQLDGAVFVAPAHRWRSDYGRRVRPGQQPLVVLQPFGPVMFVYDVSQTEAEPGAAPLPQAVVNPFSMPPLQQVEPVLEWTLQNAKADGVRVSLVPAGSQAAGCISTTRAGLSQQVVVKRRPPESAHLPVRYETQLNRDFSPTERYATLAHELGHLYCGHLGTPNPQWWPDRASVSPTVAEFEAESVGYLACLRVDDHAQMPPHLAQYLRDASDVPEGISLERIMTAAGRVIEMGQGWLAPRKPRR